MVKTRLPHSKYRGDIDRHYHTPRNPHEHGPDPSVVLLFASAYDGR